MQRKQFKKSYFENVAPIKLTEGRKIKLHSEGWGLLTDYYLESVKINKQTSGAVTSTAIIKISDRSGQTTCIVNGRSIGLLFGISMNEWGDMEDLCKHGQQLFFRQFKDGLSKNFRCEEKLFYNFCMSNQRHDVLVAVFRRCINTRNKDKSDAFLQIIDLCKCDDHTLDLYVSYLRTLTLCNFKPD